MRNRSSCFRFWIAIVLASSSLVFFIPGTEAYRQSQTSNVAEKSKEDAYRANNVGVALLEQFKYKEASDAFKRALQLQPKQVLAQINLAIALYNLPDLPAAEREAKAAIALAPNAPQPHYILGLLAKSQTRSEDAAASFQQVLKIDPNDVGANVNLGQIYSQQRKYVEAIALFRTALAAESYNATALYNLGTTLVRAGQRPEGQQFIQRFQEFRNRGSGSTLGNNYLEQGRYAEAIASTGAETDLVDRSAPAVKLTDATSVFFSQVVPESKESGQSMFGGRFRSSEMNEAKRKSIASAFGGGLALFDFDGDGDLDLFWAKPSEQQLLRNDGGKFVDVTSQSGALATKPSAINVGTVAGDYDNDTRPDLLLVRDGSVALFHNDGGGKFSDVSSGAGITAYPYLPGSAAFVDVDHDGDLDIFIAGLADLSKTPTVEEPIFPKDFTAAPNRLLRNDGTGKFTDITAEAKVNSNGRAVALVPTDYNNRRDIDLLITEYGAVPTLLSNQRDGSFRNVTTEVGLGNAGNWTCVAAGDLNKDGYTDFFFGRDDQAGVFAVSDGREKFKVAAAPPVTANARAAQFVDYDNDGLLDCVLLTAKSIRIIRNVGNDWIDVTAQSIGPDLVDKLSGSRLLACADLDNDGNTDVLILSESGQLRVARNSGNKANYSLRVTLAGKVSNRSGVGSKIEARAGSLIQKLETYSAWPAPAPYDLTFGLGKREAVDAVRVLWPAGIVQAETEIAKAAPGKTALSLAITELDRKPSSCPYLYTWNGERFEFITDFMGAGEMGYLEAPGHYNKPDPTEYVRIRDEQLKARNGRYELRVTNELEEAIYADQFKLIAIDHPSNVEVYPNEGMTSPPREFKLFTTRGARAPISAVDDHGHDVKDRIVSMDRRYPDDFKTDRIRGYADHHTLTMKLGEIETSLKSHAKNNSEKMLLLLTGWTDYSWSSDNLAASQARKSMMLPALQVKDSKGEWRTVIEDIGIPVGRPQTVTVDLTGKFLSASREVRIVTNMRIYWDQILVDTSNGESLTKSMSLDPIAANLRWRGFSEETSPDGREPYGYNYQKVSFTSPWKTMTGSYTREGDVRELLVKSDDMFVIAKPGDEISLTFDATKLPVVQQGWKRTFLLYADGFSKEMDINSATPDQVGPLPFHGMTKYPYSSPESYPFTPQRRNYIERFNTRKVWDSVASIELELLLRQQE